MAVFNKFDIFVEDVGNKVHDLVGTNDTYRVFLTDTAPVAATHQIYGAGGGAELDDLASGGGYTKGGEDTQNNGTSSGGVITVLGTDVTWTGSGGGFGPFRYVVLYNDTPTSPANPLIGWWDNGASISISAGQTFTANFGASLFTLA